MSSKIRILIIILFIFIFIAAAPLIILYSYGYRYDFRYHRLTKTGNLFVTSFPYNAIISLDGQTKKIPWHESIFIYKKLPWFIKSGGRTPANFSSLLPGKYELTLQKTNYQPWKKQIEILAEKATLLENIKLFLLQPKIERQKAIQETKNFWLSPKMTKILFKKAGSEIYVFSLDKKGQKVAELNENRETTLAINWAFNEESVTISTPKTKKIINFDGTEIDVKKFNLIKWPENNSNFIYGQRGASIYALNLKNNQEKLIFNFNQVTNKIPFNWFIREPDIYWLSESRTNSILYSYPLEPSRKTSLINILIQDADLQFHSCPIQNFIALKGENYFWLIQKETASQKLIPLFQYPLQNVAWRTNNQFLGNNDYEILIGELKKDLNQQEMVEYEIISRTSSKIIKTAWYPTGDWIIYQTKDVLYALEKEGPKRNLYQLFKADNLLNFWLNEIGFIYLLRNENNGLQILKIKIQ